MKKDIKDIKARLDAHGRRINKLEGGKGGKTFSQLPGNINSGWIWVKHAPKGPKWHAGADDMNGTVAVGTPNVNSSSHWAVKFDKSQVTEFLFMSVFGKKWVVLKPSEIKNTQSYSYQTINTVASSANSKTAKLYAGPWCTRCPIIFTSMSGSCSDRVYYENLSQECNINVRNYGADVFIRGPAVGGKSRVAGFKNLKGKLATGWKWSRHVPKGDNWHPAKDQLHMTAVYGSPKDNNKPWSVKRNLASIKEFLISLGDGQKWVLVTKAQALKLNQGSKYEPAVATSNQKSTFFHIGLSGAPYPKMFLNPFNAANTVYWGNGENGYGSYNVNLKKHNGADVYVR
jgi:hypothetical protein